MPAMPELDEDEFLELRVLLRHTVAADPFPHSPRARRLRAILAKLELPAPRAGLTFQLAADIIETSITTDWDAVGRKAAVAVIRTLSLARPQRSDFRCLGVIVDIEAFDGGGRIMSSIAIAGIVFACVFGGALLGMYLRTVLPAHHLSGETKDVVKVAIALIATMAALVLSLLISSAKSAYDTRRSELAQMSADIVVLDRTLAHYGPEAKDGRSLLRNSIAAAIERIWPTNGARTANFDPAASPFEGIYDKIAQLSPQNDTQRSVQAQALKITTDLGHTRLLLFEQLGSSIPLPFLVVMVFWLAIIFASFGIFAPGNATVIIVFLVCALSVSGAIFLILELDQSFAGMLQVSSAPLRQALARLGG